MTPEDVTATPNADLRAENAKLLAEVEHLTAERGRWEKAAVAWEERARDTKLQNDELLMWAREQVCSHQRICAEAYDAKDERNGDIHNSLACAYVSLVNEIEKRQTEKRNHEDPCPKCGFPRGSDGHNTLCQK